MGRCEESPASGEFVRRQFSAIQNISSDELNLQYFEMPPAALAKKSTFKRYAVFFSSFVKKHLFSRTKYSVLHVHFFFPTILLAISYKLFRNPKVKIVTTFHGNDVYAYKHSPWWYKLCHSFVEHSIFVTARLKQNFYKQDIKHSILCAGLLPIFSVDATVNKKYDYIFVGTLDKNKGALRLKEFAQKLPEEMSIVIVGSGPYQGDFKKLSERNNIVYHYFCDAQKLVGLYQQTKWLVNLSFNESFGLVISEAMACGLPVIATKTDGSLSQISHQENGFILEQGDSLSDQLLSINKQCTTEKYRTLSIRAQNSVEKFLLPYVAKEVKKIYFEVTRK
ncbi:glycosyltransferase [Colwellia sp. RSH04]|nr:glycosyltransferase [Colwellia sp. RSH04]